jgi:hypothetical protein
LCPSTKKAVLVDGEGKRAVKAGRSNKNRRLQSAGAKAQRCTEAIGD